MLCRGALPYLLACGVWLAAIPSAFAQDEPTDVEQDDGSWTDPPTEPEVDGPDDDEASSPQVVVEEPAEEPRDNSSHGRWDSDDSLSVPTPEEVEPARRVIVRRTTPLPPMPEHYWYSKRKFLKPIDGLEPPPGYIASKRSRQGLWVAGISTAAATYALTLVTAGINSAVEGDEDILRFGSFPLVGPFIAAGYRRVGDGSKGLLIALGLGQLAGFGMIVGGLSIRIPVWRRVNHASATSVDFQVQPTGGGLNMSF